MLTCVSLSLIILPHGIRKSKYFFQKSAFFFFVICRGNGDFPKEKTSQRMSFLLEVTPGFEPGYESFADSCLTTWLCHRREKPHAGVVFLGAGNEARTRYLHLGKVALYQMSYARRWCPEPESNQRHVDFQSTALPTELSGQIFLRAKKARLGEFQPQRDPRDGNSISWEMATRNGLEPSTSSVTG